jgi:hypothetical protein
MKTPLILAIPLVTAISQGSFARTLTSDQPVQRSLERRAVEAVNWGHGGRKLRPDRLWADVQFRFINVNLVEAKNWCPISSSSRPRHLSFSGTPASDEANVPPVPKENVMRGRMMMVLASAALAGSLLATDAQAHGAGAFGGDGGGGAGLRGNHASGDDGHGGYGNRSNGLRDGFRGYGGRDVWGHWGAYYGPMIPTI